MLSSKEIHFFFDLDETLIYVQQLQQGDLALVHAICRNRFTSLFTRIKTEKFSMPIRIHILTNSKYPEEWVRKILRGFFDLEFDTYTNQSSEHRIKTTLSPKKSAFIRGFVGVHKNVYVIDNDPIQIIHYKRLLGDSQCVEFPGHLKMIDPILYKKEKIKAFQKLHGILDSLEMSEDLTFGMKTNKTYINSPTYPLEGEEGK